MFKQIDTTLKGGFLHNFLYKMKNRNMLELFVTDSLSDMERYFEESPPMSIDRYWTKKPSAYIAIYSACVRRKEGVPEEAIDNRYEIRFPPRPSFFPGDKPQLKTIASFPWPVPFEIKTGITIQEADWIGGRDRHYELAQSTHHFNNEDFVPIKTLVVQYFHDPKTRLILREFDTSLRIQKEPLEERITVPVILHRNLILQNAYY